MKLKVFALSATGDKAAEDALDLFMPTGRPAYCPVHGVSLWQTVVARRTLVANFAKPCGGI